ncbi:hypothetical protein GALL_282350 [mine drainage metagenome]|uniref:Transmembrane protein n=1 Tax=mine drainage metagenome TaxID=410659 RepID=A0A1J5R1Q2_9ZZZZ
MNSGRFIGAARALATLACIAYPLVSYWAARAPDLRPLAVVLAWAPLMLVGAWLIWRSPLRRWAAALAVLALSVLWHQRSLVAAHFDWAYLAEHAGSLSLLGVMFGSTLRAGEVPLITRFASMVHDSMPEPVLRYTRGVTWAWTLFFATMVASSLTLFALAPLRLWAVFASVATPLLVVAMFAGEYLIRRRVLRDERHAHPFDSIRAYWRYTAGNPRTVAAATPPSLGGRG